MKTIVKCAFFFIMAFSFQMMQAQSQSNVNTNNGSISSQNQGITTKDLERFFATIDSVKALSYPELISMMMEQIKQQQKQIDSLTKAVTVLTSEYKKYNGQNNSVNLMALSHK